MNSAFDLLTFIIFEEMLISREDVLTPCLHWDLRLQGQLQSVAALELLAII